MKTLLINASLKKTGTTYLHDFFELNQDKIPNLIVPPIKEWYVIPRVPPLVLRATPLQASLGQRAEKMYAEELNLQNKEFIRRVANRPSGFRMTGSDIVDRISYILGAYDDNKIIVINDPNFLDDIGAASLVLKTNILSNLEQVFRVILFSIHRDAASFYTSLAKMNFAMNGAPPSTLGISERRIFSFLEFMANCKPQDFWVYDMSYAMHSTSQFVKDIFDSNGISYLQKCDFANVSNPNPEVATDYTSLQVLLNEIQEKLRFLDNPAGINEKKKVSSKEYAESLKQLFEIWQKQKKTL